MSTLLADGPEVVIFNENRNFSVTNFWKTKTFPTIFTKRNVQNTQSDIFYYLYFTKDHWIIMDLYTQDTFRLNLSFWRFRANKSPEKSWKTRFLFRIFFIGWNSWTLMYITTCNSRKVLYLHTCYSWMILFWMISSNVFTNLFHKFFPNIFLVC